jgi:hypothetical protein
MADDGISAELVWLDHTMVRAWSAAAAHFPNNMAVGVTCKQLITSSLTYKDADNSESTISFANPLALNFGHLMELMLVFRYQLNALIGHPKASKMASFFLQVSTQCRSWSVPQEQHYGTASL